MADARAMTRVFDELLFVLRREGLVISTAQALEAARAAKLVGLVDKDRFRDALFATLVTRRSDEPRFLRGFDAYFSGEPPKDLWQRLAAAGFGDAELAELRSLMSEWSRIQGGGADAAALFHRGSELDQLLRLSGASRAAAALPGELQLGFATHRALTRIGMPQARQRLSALRTRLHDALGDRGDLLADALAQELDQAERDVRASFVRALARREEGRRDREGLLRGKAFFALDPIEVSEVRRAVRLFAERLRGGVRVRRRRALRGAVDPHRTLRRAMRTGGVPFDLLRRRRRRDRPRLVLLCDVSESVRAAAGFMLEFVYAAHDLFDRSRSFVFVSDVAETTELFERLPPEQALAEAYATSVVHVSANSNYGRALRAFEAREASRVDRRTTLVILGDGRANYQDDGAEVVRRLRDKAKAVYWLCPEPRSQWGGGDSAMSRYESAVTKVLEVRSASDLEDAARLLVARR